MAEAGLFDEKARVELVNGEIIDVPPMGSRHAGTLYRLANALATALETRAVVRQQLPLRLSEDSEPLPDVAVVKPRTDDYTMGHPTAADAWLVAEISESTLRYDRDVKTALYGAFDVPEVWVIDLAANQVHIYRSLLNAKYTVNETTAFGLLSLAALPDVQVDLRLLAT
jgi:Uma2 family endonuclease